MLFCHVLCGKGKRAAAGGGNEGCGTGRDRTEVEVQQSAAQGKDTQKIVGHKVSTTATAVPQRLHPQHFHVVVQDTCIRLCTWRIAVLSL